jgi:hypothetical protein
VPTIVHKFPFPNKKKYVTLLVNETPWPGKPIGPENTNGHKRTVAIFGCMEGAFFEFRQIIRMVTKIRPLASAGPFRGDRDIVPIVSDLIGRDIEGVFRIFEISSVNANHAHHSARKPEKREFAQDGLGYLVALVGSPADFFFREKIYLA